MTAAPGEQAEHASKMPALSNLAQRTITAMVVLPIALFGAYVGGWLFTILCGAAAVLGAIEFFLLGRGREIQGNVVVGVPMVLAVMLGYHLQQSILWQAGLAAGAIAALLLAVLRQPRERHLALLQAGTTVIGVLYVAFPMAFLVAIRALPDGFTWLLMVFLITWGTDTFAYLGGRFLGRTKLAPNVSPKKTVEGAVVGVIGGILPPAILLGLTDKLSNVTWILIGVGPLVAIVGDLLESALKRLFQVKDSHIAGLNVLPGHGGVLDRIDALLLVSTLCYAFLTLSGIAQRGA